jgi:hypothetical protein
MEKLATEIGDLHYETLGELFRYLGKKVHNDAESDTKGGRKKLGETLLNVSWDIATAACRIEKAWGISKPFMDACPEFNDDDEVWVGSCDDDGWYTPTSCFYCELYKGSDRLPIFNSKEECQLWCDDEPQAPDVNYINV